MVSRSFALAHLQGLQTCFRTPLFMMQSNRRKEEGCSRNCLCSCCGSCWKMPSHPMLSKYDDTSNGSTKCPWSELANIASIYTDLKFPQSFYFLPSLDLNCSELWGLSPWILYVSLLTFLSQPASTPPRTLYIVQHHIQVKTWWSDVTWLFQLFSALNNHTESKFNLKWI